MQAKESLNGRGWKSMQQRVEKIRQRKGLVEKINELRKALTILSMQVENLEKKPLDQIYNERRNKHRSYADQLRQLQSVYLKLATNEMEILKSHLRNTISQIKTYEGSDIDMEDRRFSLQHTIWTLQQEMDQVMKA